MKASVIALLAIASAVASMNAAEPDKAAVKAAIDAYRPGTTGFGTIRVDSIKVDARRKA